METIRPQSYGYSCVKKWSKPIPVLPPVVTPTIDFRELEEESRKPEQAMPWFKCVSCMSSSEILYEGTSYCVSCLKEKLRTGK